jgi:hypothetical protein
MRCRVPICAACCTRLGGVNHCHACLKVLGARDEERRPTDVPWGLLGGLVLGMGWLLLWGLFVLLQGSLAPRAGG